MGIYFLKPALKETIWGGNRLRTDFGMESNMNNIAEAWMFSCHEDGVCTVFGNENLTFSELITDKLGMDCLGTKCKKFSSIEDFPVLIKLIDAADKLSVQVHPDDVYAKAHEKDVRGKTEAWYIIDCDENAELIFGFKNEISKDEFKASIENGTLLEKVNRVKIKPGDVAFISSGTLHAIGKGILLAEVQQSCNTTYRVFDYNRPGLDGKPRQLHVDKAVDVTKCIPPETSLDPVEKPPVHDGFTSTLLSKCEYFTMTLIETAAEYTDIADEKSFVSLICLDGNGVISDGEKDYPFKKGDSVFIPANSGNYSVSGRTKILSTRI